jgi:phosphoglycerol transferase MdoB-like AlkP superfamily enzyme
MPRFRIFPKRFSLIAAFFKWFVLTSFLIRLVFFFWQANEVSWAPITLLGTLFTGLIFDIATASFVLLPAIIYYALWPNRWVGNKIDRILSWFFFGLTVFIVVFSFFAEITFWEEFRSRFNFIAVDYLIYTHEVIANIQESYPLPLLITGILLITSAIIWFYARMAAFSKTFHAQASLKQRLSVVGVGALIALLSLFLLTNNQAEWPANRYNAEIGKSGIYSFFAAFRNNRMDYRKFYTTIPKATALSLVRKELSGPHTTFLLDTPGIKRRITDPEASTQKKNVVFILVESLSASFLKTFGNKDNITPFLDSLVDKSVFFENLYATGTRTVRGMEAVTLCIPPTPGQSIVKRPENSNLFTVSNVFTAKGYDNSFFYGGDGYFDNMNAYFGGNGFAIYDRGRGSVLSDAIKTERHNIADDEVTFENAWGICDEDIYRKMLTIADEKFAKGKPFFNFVMTTSNHRPYTYPSGKVAIRSGKSRQGAVQYTDFALRGLFKAAAKKPWFDNTVFVIVADHCARSAGKDEIDLANYHIPAFIVNLPKGQNTKIAVQCSQIDLFPTLFSLFHWEYESDFFGMNVLENNYKPRAFVATYLKLGYLKETDVMILSDQKKHAFYNWNRRDNTLTPKAFQKAFLDEAIAWYQTADFLFVNKLLK